MKEYIKKIGDDGKRVDGRGMDDFREIKIETGISSKAEGSAMAIIGGSRVMAGVKMDVGVPFADSADEGSLMVSFEESQIASPDWEGGPPRLEAIEVARTVDRGIRESHMVDFNGLCVKEGELVWKVFIDLYPLNYDGNIIDACSLAAIAALQNARFPKLDGDKVLFGELTDKKLPIAKVPITTTFVKVGKHIMVDPSLVEETEMDARLSVSTSGKDKINAMQKSGPGGFTPDEVKSIIEKSFKIRKVIEKALKDVK